MNTELPDSISKIVLTDEGCRPQRGAIFITDIQLASEYEQGPRIVIAKILGLGVSDFIIETVVDDKTGVRTITEIPTTRYAMSVSEIVKASQESDDFSNLTRNQVHHHIRKMEELGFIHKYGTLWIGKRGIDYYRRSSKYIVVTMATPHFDEAFLLDREGKRLEKTLDVFNIKLNVNEKKQIVKLLTRSEILKDNWRGMISNLAREDVTNPEVVSMYYWLLDAYAMGDDEYVEIWRSIREILFSKIKEVK